MDIRHPPASALKVCCAAALVLLSTYAAAQHSVIPRFVIEASAFRPGLDFDLQSGGEAGFNGRALRFREQSGFETRLDSLFLGAQLLWAMGLRLDVAFGREWLLVDRDPRSFSWLESAKLDTHGPRLGPRLRWP